MTPMVEDQTARDWIFAQAGELLKCENVGAADYFLDLGGDSLLAPVFANRIQAQFGTRPTLEDIFGLPMSELADRAIAASQPPSVST